MSSSASVGHHKAKKTPSSLLLVVALFYVLLAFNVVSSGGGVVEAVVHSRTHSCSLPLVNETPPWPDIRNTTYGALTTNKSMILNWYTSYNRNRDVAPTCIPRSGGNAPPSSVNPQNDFQRSAHWDLSCNRPNITNGSIVFYNFSTWISTPNFGILLDFFLNVTLRRRGSINSSLTITSFPVNQSRNPIVYAYPEPLIVTQNWTDEATLDVVLWHPSGRATYPRDVRINFTSYFECDVYLYILFMTPTDSNDFAVLLAFLIPLLLILLIGVLAFLRYKFPKLCSSCCPEKKDDPNNNNKRMSSHGASQPLVNIADKAGMATWLDQAQDVVADLNKTQLYLAEAQADQPSTNNNLESLMSSTGGGGGAAGGTLDAHKDGFVGGRKVFATGGSGGPSIAQKDHKVTMATKKVIDDDFL